MELNWTALVDLVSATFGLAGSVMIFFYGVPNSLNESGHGRLLLSQRDEKMVRDVKTHKAVSQAGITFIGISFAIQLVYSFTVL